MALWSNTDNANGRPTFANNSTVVGMSVAEAQANTGVAHPGWVKVTVGTGGVASVTIGAAGTGYANGDAVIAANTNGSGFDGSVTTDGNGAITAVTVSSAGSYTAAPTLTITTSGGANATLTAVLGGRAGRVFKETLVAMGSIG